MKQLSILSFAAEVKDFFINKNEKFIRWGVDNDVPQNLLKYYQSVPEHASALNFIEQILSGNGIDYVDYWLFRKLVMDYVIIGGWAVQVIKTRNGNYTLSYVSIDKLRYNPDKTKLGYSENWLKYKSDVKWLDITDSIDKEGIFLFKNNKSREDYPSPSYLAAVKSIDTASEIIDYHNNNSKNGFAPNVIINFNGGEPSDEVKDKIEKRVKDKFTGSTGQKFLLSFNDSAETATTITKLENDNLDQKFETLQKFIQNQILVSHQITSPQLIGVKAENQGFSKTEFEEAMQIFQDMVVQPMRKELEYSFSKLLNNEIKIKTLEEV